MPAELAEALVRAGEKGVPCASTSVRVSWNTQRVGEYLSDMGFFYCCVIVAPLALSSDIWRDWSQDMVGWHERNKDSRLDEKGWRGGGFSKNWLGGIAN